MNAFLPAAACSLSPEDKERNSSRRTRLRPPVVVAALLLVLSGRAATCQGASDVKLPPDVRQALEENARQLSPISVTCTSRMASRLPLAETLERLKMSDTFRPDLFFSERTSRVVWQDHKSYVSFKYFSGDVGDNETTSQSEMVCDGKVYTLGSSMGLSKETIAQQKKAGVTLDPLMRNLTREPVAKLAQQQRLGLGFDNAYFQIPIGFIIETRANAPAAPGGVEELTLEAISAVVQGLKTGWKLISIDDTLVEGRRLLRIEMEGDNPIRSGAVAYNLENQRQMLQRNREANAKQAARLTKQQKDMIERSQRQQEKMIHNIEEQRKLPATRRYTFYLDPEIHYAVRRSEQSYGPDTILTRTDCAEFQQIAGRQLWLPRKVETQLHEYYSLPETIFKEAFLSQVVEVSAFDGQRVPDETFKLDDTAPGTMIRDATDPAAGKSNGGYLSYTIPERLEDLPSVIERARKGENMIQYPGAPAFAAVPLAAPYRGRALLTIALCNVGMLGVGAVYLVRKWRRGNLA